MIICHLATPRVWRDLSFGIAVLFVLKGGNIHLFIACNGHEGSAICKVDHCAWKSCFNRALMGLSQVMLALTIGHTPTKCRHYGASICGDYECRFPLSSFELLLHVMVGVYLLTSHSLIHHACSHLQVCVNVWWVHAAHLWA